jgi:hypothetical protein
MSRSRFVSIDPGLLHVVWGGDGDGGDAAAATPDPSAAASTSGSAAKAAGGMGGMGGMGGNPMSMISGFMNIAQGFMKNKSSATKQGAPSAAPPQGPAQTQLASADPGGSDATSGGSSVMGGGGGSGRGGRSVSISIQIG